ncbi:MAG: ATP-binding protein [Acidobacteriota bacterium]|nr:ATP-binding protein [Acidobacteriota bacterium]
MEKRDSETSKTTKRSTIIFLGTLVFVLLAALVLLQSAVVWRYLQIDSASDTLILYALSSLNFFAFIIFAFILLRSIARLSRERRALKLGSRLKTRLLVYFVAVSLLPIAAMAAFSFLFLNRTLEKSFSALPEAVIREARGIQSEAIKERVRHFNEKAALFAALIASKSEISETDLRADLQSGKLSGAEIKSPDGIVLARVTDELPVEQRQKWREILESTAGVKELQDGVGFDAANFVLSDGRSLRVVSEWNGESALSREISNTPSEFESLRQRQLEARWLGFSTLSLLTFLLIFAASWVAFHLGRSLTQPIRALAEGSKEIARGNLQHRVEVLAEDELALLVESFNQMAADLENNQQRLEERHRYIETVLQSLSTGVVSLDAENRVTTLNDAARSMLLLAEKETEALFLSDLIADEDFPRLEKLIARARRLGQASEQTALTRQISGGNGSTNESGSLPVALTATALREAPGKNVGVVLVIEDLSELLAAQRAAAWQEVARRMAHEIKNPLTPIQLAAERIAKRFNGKLQSPNGNEQRTTGNEQTTKVVKESTETILREVDGLKSMVNEFSHFARLPHARLESGDLNEIVRQTAVLYEDRLADVRLETDLQENLPSVVLDAEQMRRVFVNLIDNALEAFGPRQKEKRITIKTFYDGARDTLVAEVSDNGRGIAATDFSKLFQPYFSTKGRGTGLGLAIVQRIVQEHSGRIKALANKPNGAKFIVELPTGNG